MPDWNKNCKRELVIGGVVIPPPDTAQSKANAKPEFMRLPQPGGRCFYTGLSRSYLNELILPNEQNGYKPPVRSFVLRRKGASTGVRLIDAESLFNYIRQHEQGAVAASHTEDVE